jgi:hypothetical protein
MYLLLVVLNWLGGLFVPRPTALRPALISAGRSPRSTAPSNPPRCEWHPFWGWNVPGSPPPERPREGLFNHALEPFSRPQVVPRR